MDILTVCGVTNDGKLWFLSGSEWLDVKALGAGDPGPFVSIGTADDSSLSRVAMHICGITQDGRLWYTSGYADKWQPFEDLTTRVGVDWGAFQDIGVANVNGELHVCVTVPRVLARWQILHTIRHGDGTWDNFQDVTVPGLAGLPGSFVSVACAELNKELHVCGVTDDGKLWHTVRSLQNNWLPFETVQTTFANNSISFSDVSITAEDGTLQIFAQADGDLWHTVRFSQPPGWQPVFDSLKAQASNDPGSFVSVSCVVITAIDRQLSVYGTTDDGKLWDTVRFLDLPFWFSFEDVMVEVASPGFFTSVSAAIILSPIFQGVSTRCSTFQNHLRQDCNNLEQATNTSDRNYWRGKIKQLLNSWPQHCNKPSLPSDCLS